MAGINSRPRFDTCDIPNILAITENPGKYILDESQISQSPYCINNIQGLSTRSGRVSALDHKNAASLIDIESHLYNLDTPLSNCYQTIDNKNTKAQLLASGLDTGVCNAEQLKTIYSKLDIDTTLYREATLHRFDFPIIPPTDFIYYGIEGTEQVGSNRDGVNTRLQAKDKFRMRS